MGFTYTTNLNLAKPDYNEPGANWWPKINENFDLIDTAIGTSALNMELEGSWAYIQLATNVRSNQNSRGFMSSVGSATFAADHTFSISDESKAGSLGCYVSGVADGTWEKIADGVYKASYTGGYFYNVLVTGATAAFILMSVADTWDKGSYEYGIMYRNLDVSALATYYQSNLCGSSLPTGVIKGCLVHRTAALAIAHNTVTAVNWSLASIYDMTPTIFNGQKRLTVPYGVTQVRVGGKSNWADSSLGDRSCGIYKNGTFFSGMPVDQKEGGADGCEATIWSPVVSVVAGDYFEFVVKQTSGGGLYWNFDTANPCWFSMEIVA